MNAIETLSNIAPDTLPDKHTLDTMRRLMKVAPLRLFWLGRNRKRSMGQ